MTRTELHQLFSQLIESWENEVVEFKRGGKGHSTDEIGKYFSALANEANLHDHDVAWLIFGVDDKTRAVVGTDYAVHTDRLNQLKQQIVENSQPQITFQAIHELNHPDGRVLLFEIPAAPRGLPIAWKGHYYARAGESITSLGIDKQDQIRAQQMGNDWSEVVVPEATIDHLDPEALRRAREGFADQHRNRLTSGDVESWTPEQFLERAKLTKNGQITRATLLLLGKNASAHLLSPHMCEISWRLIGQEEAYEHFSLPFLISATELYKRIRNVQIRLLPPDELIYREISKYDQRSVLEALYNCIAHQDYRQNARVIVTEFTDRLEFISVGEFYDGHPDEYVRETRSPRRYRNLFLVEAMTRLNLIDHIGYGVRRLHNSQVERYLPLPDYDLTTPTEVKLTLYGAVIDEEYSKLLMSRTDLSLEDILALDRVQKGFEISREAADRLRRSKLIEGRRPNLHISAPIAAAASQKAEYIKTKAQDDAHYAKLIQDYLRSFGTATRQEMNELLWDKLSDALNDQQKYRKVGNLLTALRQQGAIRNAGTRSRPEWELS